MMDSRLHHQQRLQHPHYDARMQDPYLAAQARPHPYQDQLPSRRDVYGTGYRSVADEPPSPIAFAVRDPYPPAASTNDVSYITPNAPPHRDRQPQSQPQPQLATRQHAFLDQPPPGQYPAKAHPNDSGAKSTFSIDDDQSLSNRSRTSSGGKKMLKRMMKELTGGPKEPVPALDENPLASKKEKFMAYGRGGAAAHSKKKKDTATMAEKSKSTASLVSDDKSASSSGAKKTGKVVYDPYLKAMVGTRGITLAATATPTTTTTKPPLPTPNSAAASPSSASGWTYTNNTVSESSRTAVSTTAGSIARAPSSRSGWDEESIISDAWPSGRSRDHNHQYASPPPSAFTYSSGRSEPHGYPSPPPSEGRGPAAWKSHREIQRRPSELSFRTTTTPTPTLDPTQLLIHTLLQQQQQNSSATPIPPPPPPPGNQGPDLASALYATLLAQQTGIPPPAPSVQQPIIPPQFAGNLDSIIAAAAAYHQLLAAATGTTGQGQANPADPSAQLPISPAAIPIQAGKGKDDVSVLNAALASYSLSTPSTAASSPSSVSALSPPPRHKQLRKATPSGSSYTPTPPRRSSSPHATLDEPRGDDGSRVRRKRSFQNLVTPPATDDGRANGGNGSSTVTASSSLTVDGIAELLGSSPSNVSFSSSLTPSPAPSTLTFAEAPPPELVNKNIGVGRTPERRGSPEGTYYRSTTLTPSASSSSLSQSSIAYLDAPASNNNKTGIATRNRSNTASQDSLSDKDQVSRAEKELLKLEKSLQSFRSLSSENMQKQFHHGAVRAPSRAAEVSRDVLVMPGVGVERAVRPVKQVAAPPPSSAAAAISANNGTGAAQARRPRKSSVSETDEEFYRRMHMALPPLPSAPSPISNPPRKDSASSGGQRNQAPPPNFSTRPLVDPSTTAYGQRVGGRGVDGRRGAGMAGMEEPSPSIMVMSPTLTEMEFPMPPSSIGGRPGVGVVRPGPRKESLMGGRSRGDYI